MLRYEDCNDNLVEVFLSVLEKRFVGFANLKFKLIFDLKKRISKGAIVFASIELANQKIKHFTKDDIAADGYDYVLIVDKKSWEVCSDKDKERMISHELSHAFIDEKGAPKILGHEIEDFYSELELNKDDPEWKRKLSVLVHDMYEQEKELKKESKEY
jgi:hypothetical protein